MKENFHLKNLKFNLGQNNNTDKIEKYDKNGNSRGFYSTNNRLNDLTGKEWVFWSKSVINKQYPPNLQFKLRSKHGAQKPPELCSDIIKIFTKEGQIVLDPFTGVGGTLIGATLSKRKAVGIEINNKWVNIYKEICKLEGIDEQKIICGDSNEVLIRLKEKKIIFDFILTDVPYWQMDKIKKSTGKFKRVNEFQRENRKSKLDAFNDIIYEDKKEWLSSLKNIFLKSILLLKKDGYLAVFIGDMYNSGKYHFISSDLANMLVEINLTMKANIVWYDVSKSLHIYGYQYQYIPSMIHQNILIFRKEFE